MKTTRYTITSRKVIAIALALVLLATVFTGCNRTNEEETTTTTTTEVQTTIEVVTEIVTDENGETVTNNNGEALTTEVTKVVEVTGQSEETTSNKTTTSTTKKNKTTTKKNTSTGSTTTTTTKVTQTTCSHKWGEWKTEQSGDYGTKKYHICSKCGKKEYASEHTHTMSTWYAYDVWTDERYCIDCKDYFETRKVDNRDDFMGNKSEYMELLDLINEERAKIGLEPHIYKSGWQKGADQRAKDLNESFSHTRPDGRKAYTAYTDNGFNCFSAAEACAKGYTTPSAVLNGWKNSERHWNLLMTEVSQNIVISRCGNCWVASFPV